MGYPNLLRDTNHSELLLHHIKSHHFISYHIPHPLCCIHLKKEVVAEITFLWNFPALVVTINSYILDMAFYIQHM